MKEQLTSVPDESPSSPASPTGLGWRRRIAFGAVIALLVAGGTVVAVAVLRHQSSSPTTTIHVAPVGPVALSASGLKTLSRTVGQPIYWAGPRRNYLYELKRTADGNVYVRYLPPGVGAGAAAHNYTIVATYPFPGALDALRRVAYGRGIQLPRGGLAVVDTRHPTSVHLAFPNVAYQVEVYDPSPARALAVASSGKVRPAG